MHKLAQPSYRVITWSEFAERFTPSFEMPFEDFAEDLAEIRLYEPDAGGNVCFSTDLMIDDAKNVVVNGNLIVNGNLEMNTEGIGGFTFVTRNIVAASIVLCGVASLNVEGNLDVKHGVFGCYGDDGGYLSVSGETTTPVVINSTYFNMSFSGAVNAVVIDASYGDLDADFDGENLAEALNPELFADGEGLDTRKVWEYLQQGKPILNPALQKASQVHEKSRPDLPEAVLNPMTVAEALQRFPALKDTIHSYGSETAQVMVCEGDVFYPGDLKLDFHLEEWPRSNEGEGVTGMIFTGNLTVEGSIVNMEGDFGPFLLVLGDLTARNIDQGGSEFYITGDCNVANVVYGYYNHGSLRVDGVIKATYLINDDHCIEGTVHPATITINNYSDYGDFDYFTTDYTRMFVKEVLENDREYLDSAKFIQRVNQGKKVLKPGAKPARMIVEDYIQELAKNGEAITELDLSDKKLKQFPRNLLKMQSLQLLNLSNNPIEKLPEDLDRLENLEELYLENCRLAELPESLGGLSKLRVLDISNNNVASAEDEEDYDDEECAEAEADSDLGLELPETVANLVNLKVLKINYNKGFKLPPALAEIHLEELAAYQCSEARPIDFPAIICQLVSLKRLDLGTNSFRTIPDTFLNLINLEELNLNSSLCYLTTMPDLSKLPKLRVLSAEGNTSYTTRPQPSPSLLRHFFTITTLEELGIDRHGKNAEHEALQAEDLQGIGNLKHLNTLDLSFNNLAELPADFWELTELQSLDLRYNCLSQALRERIAKAYPQTKIDFRNQRVKEEATAKPASPDFTALRDVVNKGNNSRSRSSYAEAIAYYDQALEFFQSGKVTDEYNLIYIHYSKMWVYSRMAYQSPDLTAEQNQQYRELCVAQARICLDLVPANDFVWHFTDEGQFHQEVIRYASNCIAWRLYETSNERSKLEDALAVIERGVAFADEAAYYYVRDTKVRILLKMGRTDDAYALVRKSLNVQPDFEDFQDLKHDPAYLAWLAKISCSIENACNFHLKPYKGSHAN